MVCDIFCDIAGRDLKNAERHVFVAEAHSDDIAGDDFF